MKNILLLLFLSALTSVHAQRTKDSLSIRVLGSQNRTLAVPDSIEVRKQGIIELSVKKNVLSATEGINVQAQATYFNGVTSKDFSLRRSGQFVTKEELNANDSVVVQFVYDYLEDSTKQSGALQVMFKSDSISYHQNVHSVYFSLEPDSEKIESIEFDTIRLELGALYLEKMEEVRTFRKEKIEKTDKNAESEEKKDLSKADQDSEANEFSRSREKNGAYLFRDNCFRKRYTLNNDVSLSIKSVEASISQGRIHKMVVHLDGRKGVYVTKGPISITNFYRKRNSTLLYSGSDNELNGTFIRVGDFLNYANSGDDSYFPSEDTLLLNNKYQSKRLEFRGTAEQFIEAKLYTDVRGLAGAENAIAQTEIDARFIMNSNNLGRSYVTLLQHVHAGFSFSKFDSKFDTLALDSYLTRAPTDLLSIVQRSNASAEIGMDIINYQPVHKLYLQGGAKIYHTRTAVTSIDSITVFDSLKLPNTVVDSRSIYSSAFYLTPGGRIKIGGAGNRSNSLIEVGLSVPFVWFVNGDQIFSQYKGTGKSDLMIAPELEMRLNVTNPEDSNKHGASIFAKIRYTDMVNHRAGSYWQVQTGVNLPLSNLISKTKE